MTMVANIYPPKSADVNELLDFMSLPEEQRVAFYGSMLAIAAADGIFARDKLDLIFETINTAGLSEHAKSTIWDYMVDTPLLSDCITHFSTSSDLTRCALMVYLIEIALADHILDVSEEEALLQARHSLHISQKQIHAIERFICEEGLIRAYPSNYNGAVPSFKHGASLLTAVGFPVIAVYFFITIGGINVPEILSSIANHSLSLATMLGASAAIAIGTAAILTGRIRNHCNKRKRTTIAHERRRRAQLAVQNLQDAVNYLAEKTDQFAHLRTPSESGNATSDLFMERLSVLQQMLLQRQSSTSAI